MVKVLFIGSFLSKRTGTKDVAEKLSNLLTNTGIRILLVSSFKNKYLRLISIIVSILITKRKLVHFDVFSGQAFLITRLGSYISYLRNRKIIFTLRGGALKEFSLKNSDLIQRVFKRADYIQTPSLFLKEYFEQLGFKIHYLPNPINFEHFKYNRKIFHPYSLLWVRAFTDIYNPALAIDILHETRKKFPNAILTMIGPDKGLLTEIVEKINGLGLTEHVKIVGPVNNNDLHKYYQTHHIYLNTTSYESFGMAIVEAAACGIPIVSTSVGEIPYLWTNEKDIMLVNSFNSSDFIPSIEKIFNDSKFANELSLNARKNVEQFDWENIKPKWIELLKSDF